MHKYAYKSWQDCGVVRDHLYSVRNENSWKHLFRDGTNIVQLGSSPTGVHRKYQAIIRGQFEGDKYYSLQHTPTGNLIEVQDNPSVADGANVLNVSQANTSRSQFTFEGRAGGLCRIKPRSAQESDSKDDLCLTVTNADTANWANVQQGLCASDSANWIVTRH